MDLLAIERLLGTLNEYQLKVANVGPGACAVAGVPGSGKTSALVARIARMARDGLPPQFVLAMTFTRAAAAELNSRLNALGVTGGKITTIHALCLDILKADAPELLAGLTLDESGYRMSMELKKAVTVLKMEKRLPSSMTIDLSGLERFITFMKSSGAGYTFGNVFGLNDAYQQTLAKVAPAFFEDTGGLDPEELNLIVQEYEKRRAACSLYDFDDMQLWAWSLLVSSPQVLKRWREMYSVVMIDESQDSNTIQWDMSFMLAGKRSSFKATESMTDGEAAPKNFMAIFDPAQSIYSWRSAVPDWAVRYAKADGITLYTLPVNYRSVPEICALSTELIADCDWNLTGPIKPVSGAEPTAAGWDDAITLRSFPSQAEEARWVVSAAQQLCQGEDPMPHWNKVAVLSRLSQFLSLVEIECVRNKIPYDKRAGGGFTSAKEVEDILAYLRVAAGFDADGKWEKRVINVPFRYIGKEALSRAAAAGNPMGLLYALLQDSYLNQKQRRSLYELQDIIEGIRKDLRQPPAGQTCGTLVRSVMQRVDYERYLREQSGSMTADESKLGTLEQLAWIGDSYNDLKAFITHIDTLAGVVKQSRKNEKENTDTNKLILSTIHRSKGLEFDYVILCDVVQGRFPWNMAFSMDEELRLLYVAITRARKRVIVTYSALEERVTSLHVVKLQRLLRGLTNASETRATTK